MSPSLYISFAIAIGKFRVFRAIQNARSPKLSRPPEPSFIHRTPTKHQKGKGGPRPKKERRKRKRKRKED